MSGGLGQGALGSMSLGSGDELGYSPPLKESVAYPFYFEDRAGAFYFGDGSLTLTYDDRGPSLYYDDRSLSLYF